MIRTGLGILITLCIILASCEKQNEVSIDSLNRTNLMQASDISNIISETTDQLNTTPHITDTVNSIWLEKYSDIFITSEWISAQNASGNQIIALFGALKNNPHQGVVQVVQTNADESVFIQDLGRYLTSEQHGTLKVTGFGAKDFTMSFVDEDGQESSFWIGNGFYPYTPEN